ncbi:MAG: four helix bundle protein [Candidatus Zixiibacteriota bacterium]
MKRARRFQDLVVWQKAHQLVLRIYEVTKSFPDNEKFGLISQMRRAAVSIPANIAEGFKKRSEKDKAKFYNISQGSLEELRYYLILAKDLKYLDNIEELSDLIDEVGRMLHGLIRSIEN